MNVLRDLLRDYRFSWGFWILVIMVAFASLSFFSPYDPTIWGEVPRDMRPSAEYWLGTDSNGQDIFWMATFAVRNSLTIALIAGLVSRMIAVMVGMIAGYLGGASDRVLMFVSDSLLVIPLFLMIVMLAMLIRDSMNVISLGLLLAIFGWAWDARLIRSQILSLREQDFTKTAILSGTGTIRMVLNEYMPYSTPLIFSTLINNMAWAIGLEITLAILGLLDLAIPTLGTMLYWAISYQAVLLGRWWWVLTPIALSIFLFVALYWLSVSVSEYLDPRRRIQRVGVG